MSFSRTAKKKIKSYKCINVEGKTIRVHRYVVEQHLGRKLLSTEIIHHKDGNIWNNDISNLEITDNVTHAKIHYKPINNKKQNGGYLTCIRCGKQKYYQPNVIRKPRKGVGYKCLDCLIKYKALTKDPSRVKLKNVILEKIEEVEGIISRTGSKEKEVIDNELKIMYPDLVYQSREYRFLRRAATVVYVKHGMFNSRNKKIEKYITQTTTT